MGSFRQVLPYLRVDVAHPDVEDFGVWGKACQGVGSTVHHCEVGGIHGEVRVSEFGVVSANRLWNGSRRCVFVQALVDVCDDVLLSVFLRGSRHG